MHHKTNTCQDKRGLLVVPQHDGVVCQQSLLQVLLVTLKVAQVVSPQCDTYSLQGLQSVHHLARQR